MDDDGRPGDQRSGSARYVFGVQFHIESTDPSASVDPSTFETRLFRDADPPGEDGWLFFRDNLWRGELGDERFVRSTTEDVLGVSVDSVDFRELRTDEAYLDAIKAAIADDLDQFNADSVSDVLTKYLGSSIHVES